MALKLEKVLISDAVDASCRRILESSGIAVDYRPGMSKEELVAAIKDYDALIVRSATKVTAEVIAAGSRLKLIGRAGTGVDNIDLDAATSQGIIVMNTPGGNTISAVEHTCGLLCCLARNTPQGHSSLKAGKWDRKKYMGVELCGKTLGIVGLGRIGREVATRMQAFGMKTVGYDPLVPAEAAAEFGVEFLELDQIWPMADFITVHTPLIPATRGLLNDAVFARCKRGVYVVNVARGGIIDEGALLRALESGQCGGAGLDVFTQEPPKDSGLRALVEHERAVVTPHLGASTSEAQLKVAQEIAQQFVDAVQGKGLNGMVNAPYLANAMTPSTHPWLQLGTKLGMLAAGLIGVRPHKVGVRVCGEGVQGYGDFIVPAVLVGALEGCGVNLVNAQKRAKELGISVSKERKGGSAGSVRVEVDDGVVVEGSVLAGRPVLTALEGCDVGMLELTDSLMVFEGTTVEEVLKETSGLVQMNQAGRFLLVRVKTLPLASTAARATVSLD